MRTIFTIEDVKNIINNIFNGNLWEHKYSNGEIAYNNPNSEKILLVDIDNGTQTEKDIAEYLNIKFYNWKQRLVEKANDELEAAPLSVFEDWVQSLNFSMNESYALVERIDEEVTASQDIDSATYMGKITFLIQTDKIKNLEYYITKVRNKFLGVPQEIQNSYGDIVKAFIMIGALTYDQEPFTMQFGECVVVSLNFRISYLANALTYSDTEIQISLNGDDTYDVDGNIVGETKYLTMPITRSTFQNIFVSNPLPTTERPDLTGFVATSLSTAKTFSFFDYINKELTMQFNDLFWSCSAHRINGKLTQVKDVNIPVFIRIKSNGNIYVYKDMIDNMQKNLTNNDFNISSITTKGWGKIQN
jgi:hypothetical protein